MSYSIVDNKAAHQYELHFEGYMAVITYHLHQGAIELEHTVVPEALGGKGIGSAIAKYALEAAIKANVKVIATCPFIKTYIERHPQYQSLVTKH